MFKWNASLGGFLRAVFCTLVLGASFAANAAHNNSFTGSLLVGKQVQFFTFTLAAPATVTIATHHHAGGTNFAGQVIPAGGFDPQLHLYDDATGVLLESNDDSGPLFDSLIVRPLPIGNYRVALTKFNNDPAGSNLSDGFNFNTSNGSGFSDGFSNRTFNWAVDILNATPSAVVAPITSANLKCMGLAVLGLPANQVMGIGQRNLVLGLINISNTYLGTPFASLSDTALRTAITRTNGCGFRGAPDSILQGGTEIDFVTACPAQETVLACLRVPMQVIK